jgi:hypothetical protein
VQKHRNETTATLFVSDNLVWVVPLSLPAVRSMATYLRMPLRVPMQSDNSLQYSPGGGLAAAQGRYSKISAGVSLQSEVSNESG